MLRDKCSFSISISLTTAVWHSILLRMMTVKSFRCHQSKSKSSSYICQLTYDMKCTIAYEKRLAASGSCESDALCTSWNSILFEQAGVSSLGESALLFGVKSCSSLYRWKYIM